MSESPKMGEKALEAMNEDPPDPVLLDILMPGMDGYQVCRKIKENPKTKDNPVIFTTVMEEDLQKNLGYSVGCAD